MVRHLAAVVTCFAAFVAAGCGDDKGRHDVTFPQAHKNPADNDYAPVRDKAEADRLCEAAQAEWPEIYADVESVTFDIPNTPSDLTCMRP